MSAMALSGFALLSAARWNLSRRPSAETLTWTLTAVLLAVGSLLPEANADMVNTVGRGVISLLPVVVIAALIAGALTAGRWSDRALAWLTGSQPRAVVIASLVGAITPVCGLGMLPLIATLLRRGVPLAPIMAFWIASPVTDPSMFLITAGIISVPFAVAKTVSAFGIGLLAGGVTGFLPNYRNASPELMRPETLVQYACEEEEQPRFWPSVWDSTRPMIKWLALALVLEVFLQRLVPDAWVTSLFGTGTGSSVILAAVVGAPMYLDGYAALPLVSGLMDKGMSFGAALALMISGAAISLYSAVAVAALVRTRVFILYILLAMLGACLAGYTANWLI